MSMLDALVRKAWAQGASDLHLEPGLPPALRVRGQLQVLEATVSGEQQLAAARGLARGPLWQGFLEQRSLDLSRAIGGVRCRINIFQTTRGVALAVRLLTSFQATVETLNLHPSLREIVRAQHGLVLISGPTGCGKSTTMAALVQEINQVEARHIITIEQPVEHALKPSRSFIRQREVGRDTPSFEQALLDALREDPDVLVVGEMREPETMRLTLAAAETGHLVLATLHASTVPEAISRLIASFGGDARHAIQAQLAGCLRAVLSQRLVWRPAAGRRVPELELLVVNDAVRNHIREGAPHKAGRVMETGAAAGMWTLDRYRRWLDGRADFHDGRGEAPLSEVPAPPPALAPPPTPAAAPAAHAVDDEGLDVGDLIAQMRRGR